jgi:hypothetical protein
MANTSEDDMTLPEFERLLEVYGSDRSRWPVAARASAGQLVARTAAARRLLAEAECLDRVLGRAPLPTLAREAALAERILTSARRSPRMVPAVAGAAQPTARTVGGVAPNGGLRTQPRWLASKAAFGSAAGALAASLTIGVLIGLSSVSQSILPAVEQMIDMTLSTTSTAGTQGSQVDLLDEDLL